MVFRKMDGPGDHYIQQNKPGGKRHVSHGFSHEESRFHTGVTQKKVCGGVSTER